MEISASFKSKLKDSFAALAHRNFRLFWFGQCISLIGTWMQNIGQAWLVMQLTNNSPRHLGYVSAIQFLPMLFFAVFAGSFADRLPKRKVLIITQAMLAVLAFTLASLTYFKVIQYWHILCLAGTLGLVNALDMPTRQSIVVELVGREDLMNAIALNSTIFNLARIIGPAIAGLLIGLVGIAVCFYLNALSFIPVIFGIWLIRISERSDRKDERRTLRNVLMDTGAGFRYIFRRPELILPLLLLALLSIFVINYNIFVPLIAKVNLKQQASGFGLLMSCFGAGALIGSLVIAARSKAGPKWRLILSGAMGIAVLLVVLGLLKVYFLTAITLFLTGFCMISFTTPVNTMLQLNSADEMRGRVMGAYSMVFGGATPIGSLVIGWILNRVGISYGIAICGGCGIVAVTVIALFLIKIRRRQSEPATVAASL